MLKLPPSFPYVVLQLVGQFKVYLPNNCRYTIKVWLHPDGAYIARVGFRLRTPAGLIGFEQRGTTLEAALEAAILEVQEAASIYTTHDELSDHMEDIPGERF